ncbi:hypothetical protein D1007_28190 [Hordeum vulgare]|nr:hypothetical protein D1007_28190 [Hordeum vulgare]
MKEMGRESSLDVSHIMWRELCSIVLDRKVPIYGPYFFKLVEDTWVATFPNEPLVTDNMVHRGIRKLRVKENWGIPPSIPEISPTDSNDEPEPDYADDPPSETDPS